jgi:predicted permease
MADVLGLALPSSVDLSRLRLRAIAKIDEHGLAWLNFFILYVALPALFFYLVSRTPFEQINWSFVLATTLSTFWCFALAPGRLPVAPGQSAQATIVVGAYANVGYMGPGLTLAALGPQASVPTALIFVFDSTLFFAAVPFLIGVAVAPTK